MVLAPLTFAERIHAQLIELQYISLQQDKWSPNLLVCFIIHDAAKNIHLFLKALAASSFTFIVVKLYFAID
jgi:hypothetical protein